MPNQLSEAKIRKSVAEHRALFAVLDSIVVRENISSTELILDGAVENHKKA